MQTANVIVRLGGDAGNTVPKYDVTPSEIALLRAIHGDEAVQDIEPLPAHKLTLDGVQMTQRGELNRLRSLYGSAKDSENHSHFDILFPGAAARAFETIAELDLPDTFFKPTGRMASVAAPTAKADAGLQALTVTQLKALAVKNGIDLGTATKKPDIIDVIEAAAAEVDDVDAEPGEGDMLDAPRAAPASAGSNLFT